MDKYDIVLDLVEHPEKYTERQIDALFSDPEARELYNLLCKTESSLKSHSGDVDVEAEWLLFSKRHAKSKFRLKWFGNRAASITAIAFTSLAAVAISISVAINSLEPRQPISEVDAVEYDTSGYAKDNHTTVVSDTVATVEETVITGDPVLYENESLELILNNIAEHHNMKVEYKTPVVAQLHLYYRFDPSLSLKETIEQLNTFEQISIRIVGNKIIVD